MLVGTGTLTTQQMTEIGNHLRGAMFEVAESTGIEGDAERPVVRLRAWLANTDLHERERRVVAAGSAEDRVAPWPQFAPREVAAWFPPPRPPTRPRRSPLLLQGQRSAAAGLTVSSRHSLVSAWSKIILNSGRISSACGT